MATGELIRQLKDEMKRAGYRARTVSISHLPEIQDAVGKLIRQGLIDKSLYENWHFYLDNNKKSPDAKSIIIVAIPQAVTHITFIYNGKKHSAYLPPGSIVKEDEAKAEEILNAVLSGTGYKIVRANLALKTLAVRSGLARYGRNNIVYVAGMGSYTRLVAFYSDCPFDEDNWQDTRLMKTCENCSLCRENCQGNSITPDRFLIRAENCRKIDESEKDFRDDRPDMLVGCMRCQWICPVNKQNINKVTEGPVFTEEETALVLNGTSLDKLPENIHIKLDRFTDSVLYSLLVKNLRKFIRIQQS